MSDPYFLATATPSFVESAAFVRFLFAVLSAGLLALMGAAGYYLARKGQLSGFALWAGRLNGIALAAVSQALAELGKDIERVAADGVVTAHERREIIDLAVSKVLAALRTQGLEAATRALTGGGGDLAKVLTGTVADALDARLAAAREAVPGVVELGHEPTRQITRETIARAQELAKGRLPKFP